MPNTLKKEWESKYLPHLRELVSRRSVFTEKENVEQAMQYCQEVFEEALENHKVFRDVAGNLIALPNALSTEKDVVYLSAHIDTVDADKDLWDAPYSPFELFENESELVALGVNDCKAGVAFILWVTELILSGELEGDQIVLTVTFKEEGTGEKTALEIGRELGKSLPVSEQDSYLIVLENNVRVEKRPILCVYASERSNYAVEVEGTLSEIQKWLEALPNFNPVSCFPSEAVEADWEIHEQEGGHICSVPRESNLLMSMIMNARPTDLISAGKSGNFSVVPAEIRSSQVDREVNHTLVMGNRGFDSVEHVEEALKVLPPYKRLKPFEYACGFNIEDKFQQNKVAELLTSNESIDIELSSNPGASDGTHIYAAMNEELRSRFFPIVMGPGCRSQRHVEPARLTHGKNETFDKKSGAAASLYLIDFIRDLTKSREIC